MPDWPKEIRAAVAPLDLDPMDEVDLVEELSQHLQDRYDEMLTSGMDAEQAYDALRKELNDGTLVSALKQTMHRGQAPMAAGRDGGERLLSAAWKDLLHGARLL